MLELVLLMVLCVCCACRLAQCEDRVPAQIIRLDGRDGSRLLDENAYLYRVLLFAECWPEPANFADRYTRKVFLQRAARNRERYQDAAWSYRMTR